ncbi:MAG: class I SAM-dependent methyltransferase [archaeon]|nr:class I SAM-dependent methyltransferase [Nanoarchaeota archaeon]
MDFKKFKDYKERTIESYNKNVKILSEKFKDLLNLKQRYEFPRFMGMLPGNKILDLGCGAGDHAYYFSKQGLDVTCIDLSKKMVELCKDKGLDARVMDIERLDFKDDTFDGIWAVTSLLHVPKKKLKKVIKKLHAILKPKGILYVSVKEGEGEKMLDDKLGKGSERFFSFWKEEELIGQFKDYFKVVEKKITPLNGTNFLEVFFKKK